MGRKCMQLHHQDKLLSAAQRAGYFELFLIYIISSIRFTKTNEKANIRIE